MEIGKKIWVFGDGDLPPQGAQEPFGHEALMITNYNDRDADITMTLLFEDREPAEGIHLHVAAKRVHCFRLDYPIGDEQYQIKPGQYSVILNSSEPVVCVFGRLDRRKDMAYYTVSGYSM